MILVIDNYDSFTYNLVQYVKQIGEQVKVVRNDDITVQDVFKINPLAIIISPGPGRPESAGICLELVKKYSGKIPILGVCLGHQTIAQAFGGKIVAAKKIMHGKTSNITCDGKKIYKGLKKPFQAMRYHSLAVEEESLPECFVITSRSDDEEIMGLRHISHNTEGIQFHPESIMTIVGKRILRNFLTCALRD